eukprot:10770452-Lingulodinium_polyedra.AAC.1
MLEEEVVNLNVADDQTSALPLRWVPTHAQLGDELTKKTDGKNLRILMRNPAVTLVWEEPDAAQVAMAWQEFG